MIDIGGQKPLDPLDPNAPLTPEERAAISPVYTCHADIFDLSDDEDRKKYEEISTRIANNNIITRLHKLLREYDTDKKNWRVLLEWAEVTGGKLPPNLRGTY